MAEFLQQCGSWGVLATLAAYAAGVLGMFRSPHSEEFRAAVEQVCVTASMISTALGYRKQEETL